MATKQITITIADWVFEQYLSHITINRSQYIERLIVLGSDVDSGSLEVIKSKNLSLLQELRNKDDQIKLLNLEVGKLKKQIKPEESPEEIRARQFHKGRRMAGLNRKLADKMEF